MEDLIRRVVLITSGVLFLALGLLGCQSFATPEIEQTTPTRQIVETASPTQVVPTRTSIPTSTPDPLVEQARAFAGPILEAIADRPPDYQDDFSDPTSGWDIKSYANGDRSGRVGYEDGEYFLFADAASAQYRNVHSWLQIPGLTVSDFAMEFDARFVSAQQGTIYTHFRVQKKDVYAADISLDGWVRLGTATINGPGEGSAEASTDLVKPGQTNRIRIIALGPQIALYLNDQPVLMFHEEFVNHGGVILGIWNGSSAPIQVNFDNVKFWNLENVPGLP